MARRLTTIHLKLGIKRFQVRPLARLLYFFPSSGEYQELSFYLEVTDSRGSKVMMICEAWVWRGCGEGVAQRWRKGGELTRVVEDRRRYGDEESRNSHLLFEHMQL